MTVTAEQTLTDAALPRALAVRRWAVIGAAGLGGILVFVSMLVDPAPSADGRELVAAYAEDVTASGLHTNLIHYGFALSVPVAYAMVHLVRRRGAWLANLGWLLAVIGLSTLPGLVLLDFAGTAAVRATDVDTAMAIVNEMDALTPFIAIAAPAFLAAVLAAPVATGALVRAGIVPWPALLAVVVASLAPNFLPWVLGFGLYAVGWLVLAWFLWRIPAAEWDR